MKEITNVRQHPSEHRRRWFCDEDFELIVWFEEPDRIVMFELSYDLQGDWRALRWREASGFEHFTVDDGEDRPHRNAAPMLRPNPKVPPKEMFDAFESRSNSLDSHVAGFVRTRLFEYRALLYDC